MTKPTKPMTTVRISVDGREKANALVIALAPGAGRRLTLTDVLEAAVSLADSRRDDLVALLKGETP